MDKEKGIRIFVIVALIAVILFAVITSIVLESKRKKLEDLNDKNDIVKPTEKPESKIIISENLIEIKTRIEM